MNGKVTPERLAALVAEALRPIVRAELREAVAGRELSAEPDEWITANECAARFGHTARWWRDHAGEFGAARDGGGPRPRIMFNRATVERARAERR